MNAVVLICNQLRYLFSSCFFLSSVSLMGGFFSNVKYAIEDRISMITTTGNVCMYVRMHEYKGKNYDRQKIG